MASVRVKNVMFAGGSRSQSMVSSIGELMVSRNRKKRICFYVTVMLGAALLSFAVSRVFSALDITNTSPVVQTFYMGSLCSDSFSVRLTGTLDNPSIVGAAVVIDSAVIKSDDEVLATLAFPEVDVIAGFSTFDVTGTASVCEDCIVPTRAALQDFLSGVVVNTTIEVAITARFASDVFIFPVSFSTSLTFETSFDPFRDPSETKADREALAANSTDDTQTLAAVALTSISNTSVAASLGLNLSSSGAAEDDDEEQNEFLAEDFEFFIDVPKLTFQTRVDGLPVAFGVSDEFTLGDTSSLLFASVLVGWSDVDGVNKALDKFTKEEDMSIEVEAVYDESLLTADDLADGKCFLATLIEGVELATPFEFYEETEPSGTLAEVLSITVDNITASAEFFLNIDTDITGIFDVVPLTAVIPPLDVVIAVNNSAEDARDVFGFVVLQEDVNINSSNPILTDVMLEIDLDDLGIAVDLAEHLAGTSGIPRTPNLFLSTVPNGELFPTLFSTLVVEVPLISEDEEVASSRRMLQDQSQASVVIEVTAAGNSFELLVNATDLSTETFFGFELFVQSLQGIAEVNGLPVIDFFTSGLEVSKDTLTSFNFRINVSDDTGGSFLIDALESFRTFETLILSGEFMYGDGPLQRTVQNISRSNWTALRAEEETEVTATSASTSAFSIAHVELQETRNDADIVFVLQVFADLGLQDFRLILPEVALSVRNCDLNSALVELITSPVVLTLADASFEELEAVVRVGKTADILSSLSSFNEGNDLRLCLQEHTTQANFFSSIVAALEFSVLLEAPEEQVEEEGSSVETLDLVIESDTSTACLNLSFDLNVSAFEDLTVGWGDIEVIIGTDGDDFFSLQIGEAFVGDCSSFWATGSCVDPPQIVLRSCLFAAGDVEDAVVLVRDVLSAGVFEQLEKTFDISGTVGNRRFPAQPDTSYGTNFTLPDGALDDLTSGQSSEPSSAIGIAVGLDSWADTTIGFNISSDIFDDIGNVQLTLPLIEIEAFTDTENGVTKLVDVSLDLTSATNEFAGFITVVVSSYNTILTEAEFLSNNASNLIGIQGSSLVSANFLSRVIPRITSGESSETGEVTGRILLDADVSSTATTATITAQLTTMEAVTPLKFTWLATSLSITDTVTQIATLDAPAATLDLDTPGSTTGVITLVLSGNADDFLDDLFTGSSISLAVAGTTGPNAFNIGTATFPSGLLSPAALGSSENSDAAANTSITLTEVMVLGGDDVGSNVVLPCLVDGYCANLLKDEGSATYSGLTVGVSLEVNQSTSILDLDIALNSDVHIDVGSNGFDLGVLRVHAGTTFTTSGGITTVGTFTLNSGQSEEARISVQAFLEGYDSVVTISGSSSNNYLSLLINAISQDIFIESEGDVGGSDEAGQLGGEIDLALLDTALNLIEISAGVSAEYGEGPDIPVGTLSASILSGHDGNGDNGVPIAAASIQANDGSEFALKPQPGSQTITAIAAASYSNAAEKTALDVVISKFVFSKELPLELVATVTPGAAAAKYPGTASQFTIQTWFTLPKQASSASFIQDFEIDYTGSILASIGDIQLSAVKVVNNTLPWPILISYFTYEIWMYDTDASSTDGCFVNVVAYGPCALGLCATDPWGSTPQNIGAPVTTGSSTTPLNGPNGNSFINPGDTEDIGIIINPDLSVLGRMYEEFKSNKFCADIRAGVIIVAMQADVLGCTDTATTLTADLDCTFIAEIDFTLEKFGLTDDSCTGEQLDVDNFITFETGFANLNALSLTNLVGTIALAGGGDLAGARWEMTPVSVRDSFVITWQHNLDRAFFGGFSDGYSLVWKVVAPLSATDDNYGNLDNGYNGITNSLAVNFYYDGCMSMNILKDGSLNNPLFRSNTLVSEDFLNDEVDIDMEVRYDAYAKRMYVQVGPEFYSEFDLDLRTELESMGTPTVTSAYIGFVGKSDGLTQTTDIDMKSIVISYDTTASVAAIRAEGPIILPAIGEVGTLTFLARSAELRPRGSGGDLWTVTVTNADSEPFTTTPVSGGAGCTTSGDFNVCDNDDGSYTIQYIINNRGRYIFEVACQVGGTCVGTGNSFLTNRVFVRDT